LEVLRAEERAIVSGGEGNGNFNWGMNDGLEKGEFYFLPCFGDYNLPLFTLTLLFCYSLLCQSMICPFELFSSL
jgi:hypothetical protein